MTLESENDINKSDCIKTMVISKHRLGMVFANETMIKLNISIRHFELVSMLA